jgi:predicted O-methyltransferase YrrM
MAPSVPSRADLYLSFQGAPPVVRARMAGSAARLLAARQPMPRALGRALLATAGGRADDAERDWFTRIERWRAELDSRRADIRAEFAPGRDGMPAWTAPLDGPMPAWGISQMFSIPPLWGRLLTHLVRELRPRSCIELGTAFGISTCYQAAGLSLNGSGRLITLDAAQAWGEIAREGFEQVGLAELVEVRVGQLAEALPVAVADGAPVDFAFVDAEHQEEPTVSYFETMLPHLAPAAVVVFDDIGFPAQMRRAWKRIAADPRVAHAATAGRIGIVAVR